MTNRKPVWKESYKDEAAQNIIRYFGDYAGLTSSFPAMRDDYRWGEFRPPVPDSRVPAKNNNEYHGLEKFAGQYQAAAMYEEAGNHWLMAAFVRKLDMDTHGFNDEAHKIALTFCLGCVAYNRALKKWSDAGGRGVLPAPSVFGLSEDRIAKIEAAGSEAINRRIMSPGGSPD